jgi:Spy/CpxP family protein refolding chaperone
MKSWKVLAAAVVVAAVLVGVALTQPPGRGRPDGPPSPPPFGPVLDRALDELKLGDKEKEQAHKIVQAHREKVRKLVEQAHEELIREMQEVLGKEQFEQFKEAVQRRPPGGPGGPGGPGRGVSADELVERIMSFDKNKDGKVTKDELPERMHYLLELGDTNKDGALDKDEIKALAAKLQREGPPRRPGAPPAPGRDGDGPPPPPPPPPGPGGPERALEELRLSDKQKEQAHKILDAHHEEMRKLRDKLLKEMKDVLDKDQFERFKDAVERTPPPPPGRPGAPPPPPPDRRPGADAPPPPPPPGGPGGPGGLERALDELKLSDKDKEKAHKVLQGHHEKMRKLFEQAREDLLKDMKDVLNKDQLEQFKKAMERRPPPGGPGGRPPAPPPPPEE